MHPLIVHFPIVCLVLYSLMEIVSRLSSPFRTKFSFTKIVMLTIGVIGWYFALLSWEVAQELLWNSDLIHTHEEFAEITFKIYLIILIIYLISRERIVLFLKKDTISQKLYHYISQFIGVLNRFGIIALLSLIGCAMLSITGALGWAISHGPETDPIVSFVYKMVIWPTNE